MKKKDIPIATERFDSYHQITLEVLQNYGIKGILSDLDDTIVSHNYPKPDSQAEQWFSMLEKNGFKICLISNNRKKRVAGFVQDLKIGYFCNSFKPSVHTVDTALAVMNITKDEAVFIGDQLFTDIRMANRAEIRSFLVKPVGNKATLFIRIKRVFERKILNDMH